MQNETTKQEQTRKFHQDFLWGLNHLKTSHDALMETAALRYLMRCCEKRINDLNDEAVDLAIKDIARQKKYDGTFMHEAGMYELKVHVEVVL